jgi:hypothetical protein
MVLLLLQLLLLQLLLDPAHLRASGMSHLHITAQSQRQRYVRCTPLAPKLQQVLITVLHGIIRSAACSPTS